MALETQLDELASQSVEKTIELLIEKGNIEVPILPEVANKTLIMAQSAESNAMDIANLIQSDQSLAGHVMRIANSAAYTPLANLVSLQQAVARLGMGIMSEIALTAAIGTKFFHTPGYDGYVETVWQHAIATSQWAKEIARHCRGNVEVAFLAGLLHSIGRPTTLQIILEQAKSQQIALSEEKVHHLEDTFCQKVRDVVVSEWKMPALVVQAISGFEEDDSVLASHQNAAIVSAAVSFANNMLDTENTDSEWLNLSTLTSLNLYEDDVEALLAKTEIIKARLQGLSS
jgi:putative nucleotidyltransferase with HDIG domain